jgi:cytochrome c-type biogenesis protein CcmH
VRARHVPLFTLLAVVLVVALVVGSGALSSSPATPAQRAYAIESVLRCPSCEDLSVADSTAQTAVAVRATVRRLLAEGRTDQQVESYLVARYGSTIVLDPPARGWPLLVWVLPLVGGAVAVVVLGTFLFRRRAGVGDPDTAGHATDAPLEPAQLEERRQFLTRSLADADAEYLAGDLSDRDYVSLRRRDLRRLASVEAQLGTASSAADGGTADLFGVSRLASVTTLDRAGPPDAGEASEAAPAEAGAGRPSARPAPIGRTSPTRPRRWLLRGAAVSFAAALIVAVSLFASDRLPGQSATGTVSLTGSQQLAQVLDQAAALENQGQLGQAAQLYQSVLSGHPGNEVALAQLGWLEYQTGRAGNSPPLMTDAEAKLERATRLDPGDYAASLYLGTVLLQRDGNAAGAVGQFQRFLADGPPPALLRQAAPELRQAYAQAGLAVPAQVPTA